MTAPAKPVPVAEAVARLGLDAVRLPNATMQAQWDWLPASAKLAIYYYRAVAWYDWLEHVERRTACKGMSHFRAIQPLYQECLVDMSGAPIALDCRYNLTPRGKALRRAVRAAVRARVA